MISNLLRQILMLKRISGSLQCNKVVEKIKIQVIKFIWDGLAILLTCK